jgi:hypothetical protein
MDLVLFIAIPTLVLAGIVAGLALWARQGREDNASMVEDYGGDDTSTVQPGFGAFNLPGGGSGGAG